MRNIAVLFALVTTTSTQLVYAPENSPRYMSDFATPNRNRVDYGVNDAIYVDVYAKRSILNKLLTYLNAKDTIAQMKMASPGIDQYDTMNYTLASIGLGCLSLECISDKHNNFL